jgi:hypothetical protein
MSGIFESATHHVMLGTQETRVSNVAYPSSQCTEPYLLLLVHLLLLVLLAGVKLLLLLVVTLAAAVPVPPPSAAARVPLP